MADAPVKVHGGKGKKHRPHIRPNARGKKHHSQRAKEHVQKMIAAKGGLTRYGLPPKGLAGRPTILTDELQDALVAALERGNYLQDACDLVGTNRKSVQEWVARGLQDIGQGFTESQFARFAVAVKRARAQVGDECLQDIRDKVDRWQASAWFLERTRPAQFGQTARLEHTGADGGPIQMQQSAMLELSRLTPTERDQLEYLLNKAKLPEGVVDTTLVEEPIDDVARR